MRRFIVLGLGLLFAGCFGTYDISHQKIFGGAVGVQLVTKRQTFLFHYKEYEAVPEFRKTAILNDFDPAPGKVRWSPDRAEFHVPMGQAVRVLRIEKDVGDGIVEYYALGEIYVPAVHRFVLFRYSWGHDDKVFRAPWEGNEVPLVRRPPSLM